MDAVLPSYIPLLSPNAQQESIFNIIALARRDYIIQAKTKPAAQRTYKAIRDLKTNSEINIKKAHKRLPDNNGHNEQKRKD